MDKEQFTPEGWALVPAHSWRDRVFRFLTKPPFTGERVGKGWLERWTRAPRHRAVELKLTIPEWPRWWRPLRVAFLSDFHTGAHSRDVARFQAIVAEAANLRPDLALFGGDFVNLIPFGGGRVPPQVTAWVLAALPARLGHFAVLGNHDRNYGAEEVTRALQSAGIVVLNDERRQIEFNRTVVDLVGIPDARRDGSAARELLAGLNPGRPTIVLAHDPYWFAYMPSGPHLMLAGHTHAGQITIPGLGPVRNASWAPLRWTYGLIEENGRRMYVTSGLGTSALPLRIGTQPEFVLLEINGLQPSAWNAK